MIIPGTGNPGTLAAFDTGSPATLLATADYGGALGGCRGVAAVAVRGYGYGLVVGFGLSGNYYLNQHVLSNVNVQQLYVNAIAWAGEGAR